MQAELQIGDWVTSYHAGIWQISRILQHKGRDPLSGREALRTTIFSRRFVSPSFKRSFTTDACDPFFVKPLDPASRAALDDFLQRNSALLEAFAAYRATPVDCVYNARIGVPGNLEPADVAALIPRNRLFNELEIAPFLESLGFDTEALPPWTVQFLSKDHRCVDGYLVYEFAGVLSF